MDSTGFSILSIIILIAFSAFFSASETAVTGANRLKIKAKAEDGDKKAKRALKLVENFDKSISSILVGNNIVNIAATSIATVAATSIWKEHGAVIATVAMTVLLLAFGEILPKSLAKTYAEKLVISWAKPIGVAVKIFYPISYIFSGFKMVVSKQEEDDKKPSYTEDELKVIMEEVQDEGVLEEGECELAQSALDFDDIEVGEVLTPRVNMVAVDIKSSAKKIKEKILAEKYTRIPVYKESVDNIVGIINAKDFLSELVEKGTVQISEIMQEATFFPDTLKISTALSLMQKDKIQLAVVTDQYGGTAGIVTMEDILEELVGEIWDEHDEVVQLAQKISDNKFKVDGNMDTDDMLDELEFDGEPIDSRYNTVSGWIGEILDKIPEVGDWFTYENLKITIEGVEDNRVTSVIVEILPRDDEEETDDN